MSERAAVRDDLGGGWRDELDPVALATLVSELSTACREGRTVVIAGHIGPDGDALGSVLALHLALGAAGARTVPTIGEQALEVPASLTALPGIDGLVPADRLPPAAEVDLVIAVDTAAPQRLGTVAELVSGGVRTAVLDHHARGESFGNIALVAPSAAATTQLVAEVLDALDLPLTTEVATCLYVGLVTDTGRFSYDATDASALELGARLLAAGVDQAGWSRTLFEQRPLADLPLLGVGLARAELVADVGLVHTHLTAEEVAAHPDASTESLIDLLRSADVAEAALTLRPDDTGAWRGSLRSRGNLDVGRVAEALGGGGHRLAAGFTTTGTPEAITARVVDLLREG